MKTVLPAVLMLTLVGARGTPAEERAASSPTITASCCDAPSRWAPRHAVRGARLAITTEDGSAVLLLTDDVVAVQLSERVLEKVRRKERENGDDDGVLGSAIKAAVLASVRSLLDHSAECPIRDVASANVEAGRLVLTSVRGDTLFRDMKVDNRVVMESFTDRNARAFVRELRRLKARTR